MKENQFKYIGIISTSLSLSVIDKQLQEIGIKNLESIGIKVKFGINCRMENGYTSGSIEERVEDINNFLDDKDIDIIMTSIGGYNSNQLLEFLDYEKIKNSNKIFIGYSDTTALLNAIYKKTDKISILGPAFVTFCDPNIFEESIYYFLKVICKDLNLKYYEPNMYAYDKWFLKNGFGPRDCKNYSGWNFIKGGKAKGKLIGGNCETFLALAGTEYIPDSSNKILLLEGVENEEPAKFDRELTQLKHMGILQNLKGLIIGQFSDENELSNLQTLKNIILRVCDNYNFPIVVNTPFSHVSPIYSIPIGGEVEINSENNTISLLGSI